jgi:hypothetical protein
MYDALFEPLDHIQDMNLLKHFVGKNSMAVTGR